MTLVIAGGPGEKPINDHKINGFIKDRDNSSDAASPEL